MKSDGVKLNEADANDNPKPILFQSVLPKNDLQDKTSETESFFAGNSSTGIK